MVLCLSVLFWTALFVMTLTCKVLGWTG